MRPVSPVFLLGEKIAAQAFGFQTSAIVQQFIQRQRQKSFNTRT
ncbi:hypothetical protein ONK29_27740 [Salmonella enterica subsp. enterica serovar Anatum]|nr:hypothetical protein [Salmonella enterica subsp. enterica serovar Anatum]